MTTWHTHEVVRLQEQAKAEGRAEERAEIVAYMRREAVQFMASGVGASVLPGKQGEVAKMLFDVMGAAVEGLAGFFEDGGHLK